MKLSGSFVVAAPRASVYDFLTDVNRLVPVLPDVESYEVHDVNAFTLNTKVGVSFMRGVMKVRMRVVEQDGSRRALFKGQASGLGSTVDLDTGFDLTDASSGGTEVAWQAEAKIGGRLASVGGGVLEPIAKKNIAVFVDAIQKALAEVPTTSGEAGS